VPKNDLQPRQSPGRMAFLSGDDKAVIYEAALEILAEIGMRVHHDGALGLLRSAGCPVEGDPTSCAIPRELVEQARATPLR
jgi:trimethylamine:corrinoid methyltransferase-like protein